MNVVAHIAEIFSSLQGEGPRAGERMTFVRFGRCTFGCQFCDTPRGLACSETFRVEDPPGSERFLERRNPVTPTALGDILCAFTDDPVSITGGEPLEQEDFLAEWLPSIAPMRRILLETNGLHHEALVRLLPWIHIVSMDIKLPSSAGTAPRWPDHAAFLHAAIAAGRETCVKIVVTAQTTDRDIGEAIAIVARVNRFIPVILQPASATLRFHTPPLPDRVESAKRLCEAYLPDVRVIPQLHKAWGVL